MMLKLLKGFEPKLGIKITCSQESQPLGGKGRRIGKLISAAQQRFMFPENSVELFAEKVIIMKRGYESTSNQGKGQIMMVCYDWVQKITGHLLLSR